MDTVDESELFDVFESKPKSRDLSKYDKDQMRASFKRVSEQTNAPEKKDQNIKGTELVAVESKKAKMDIDIEEDVPISTSAADLLSTDEFRAESTIQEEEIGFEIPQITGLTLETEESCQHEVVFPVGVEYVPLAKSSEPPVKTFPFTLDPFQKEAVMCVENKQSVLVSAHTSAGKTVVALYAIAQSLKQQQRVIYTTPIKALSNQKYRELLDEFQDVGLQTGDITINPNASCVVMTTEILRSMLYKGSEITREVAWVIFDEIHYMRDKERGVVWEETLILLPDNVRYVFLSATLPNARQFAEWISYLHRQPCHVVYTEYRPTPLQHYIYPSGGDGLYLVVDEKREFREESFNKAMALLQDSDGDQDRRKSGKSYSGPSSCFKIVKMAMEKEFAPIIVFSFGKAACENYALQVSKLKFNQEEEEEAVEKIFNSAVACLTDEDKKLPQIENLLPLLKRGIGVHHSGLLPLLKEVVEILFGEGLIKALFATETFAMGLNMPARTVLFTSARKFDGREYRWLSSGEYIQMSGRAGRRGIDDRGIVILVVDDKMPADVGKSLLQGEADPLNSAFRLTYNMVLNLLRVEGVNPEYMLAKSFHQFQHSTGMPALLTKLKELEDKHKAMTVSNEDSLSRFFLIRQQLEKLRSNMMIFIHNPKYILPFLQPGRLVKVHHGSHDFGWGCVINFMKKANHKMEGKSDSSVYVVEALLHCSKTTLKNSEGEFPMPCRAEEKGEWEIVPVLLNLVQEFSCIRLYMPKDLRSTDARLTLGKSIKEAVRRFPDGVPLLDPVEDINIKEEKFISIIKKIRVLEKRLLEHPLYNSPRLADLSAVYSSKVAVLDEIADVKKDIKIAKSSMQMDELKCRKRVLRRLGYVSLNDVIERKGRVACEVFSADELMLTEMLFNGVFNELTPEQCAALLSCFVFQEKGDGQDISTEDLAGPLRQLQETAKRIAKVSEEARFEMSYDDYVDSFKPDIMPVVYSWARGANFASICKMTEIFEGSIIRCMRRLEEVLRQMCMAAKSIGNMDLENKFAIAITKIKRDIVFAASLYL